MENNYQEALKQKDLLLEFGRFIQSDVNIYDNCNSDELVDVFLHYLEAKDAAQKQK